MNPLLILGQGDRARPPDMPDKAAIDKANAATIRLIAGEYVKNKKPWFLGYSGGKDSSALLKLVYLAMLQVQARDRPSKPVYVAYCDTGVEIPLVQDHVEKTLAGLAAEAAGDKLPIHVRVAKPSLEDRFFVKVIGRGYPPPTNKFRWCTDRLRIKPIQRLIEAENGGKSIVLLGIRRGESIERDRVIRRYEQSKAHYFSQNNNKDLLLLCPIIDYSHSMVWSTLLHCPGARCVDAGELRVLYKEATGECPIVRDPKGSPCSKGRFGCWTCTVIRKDHALINMVAEGHHDLAPLLEWKQWLLSIRDMPYYRYRRRRNGNPGLGPFTLTARKRMLAKLREAEAKSGRRLILDEEIQAIERLWLNDAMIRSKRVHIH